MKPKGLWLPVLLCLTFWSFAIAGCNKSSDTEPTIVSTQEIDDTALIVDTCALVMQGENEEILRIEYDTGDIYYHGKHIVNDKELVKAFRNMFGGYVCPHCGRSMYKYNDEVQNEQIQ